MYKFVTINLFLYSLLNLKAGDVIAFKRIALCEDTWQVTTSDRIQVELLS